MADDPRRRANLVLAVEMSPYQAKLETNGEAAERQAEHIHFVVDGTSREKQANQAKDRHHRTDDDRTSILVHQIFPLGLARSVERVGAAGIDPDQSVPLRNGAWTGDDWRRHLAGRSVLV